MFAVLEKVSKNLRFLQEYWQKNWKLIFFFLEKVFANLKNRIFLVKIPWKSLNKSRIFARILGKKTLKKSPNCWLEVLEILFFEKISESLKKLKIKIHIFFKPTVRSPWKKLQKITIFARIFSNFFFFGKSLWKSLISYVFISKSLKKSEKIYDFWIVE